jgi:hypothetical protein
MSDARKPSQRLATIKEACAYAKMGKSKLYRKLAAGDISAFKRDSQTLVDLNSIDAMNERECVPWRPEVGGGIIGGT